MGMMRPFTLDPGHQMSLDWIPDFRCSAAHEASTKFKRGENPSCLHNGSALAVQLIHRSYTIIYTSTTCLVPPHRAFVTMFEDNNLRGTCVIAMTLEGNRKLQDYILTLSSTPAPSPSC